MWRRRFLRLARRTTASLIASLLLRCKRRVPVAPSVLCFTSHITALRIASLRLRCERRMPVAPLVPSPRSSHDSVAHCFASPALPTPCACGAIAYFRFARHMTGVAHCLASLASQAACVGGAVGFFALLVTSRHRSLLPFPRCEQFMPVAPSVPSPRLSHDGPAHCLAPPASQTACACGAVGPCASLDT